VQSSYRGQYLGVVPVETVAKPETYRLVGLDLSYEKKPDPAVKKIVTDLKKSLAAEKKKLLKQKNP
jgi:hypothetical protein